MGIIRSSFSDGFKLAISVKRVVPLFLVNIALLFLILITFYFYPILDFQDLISKSFLQIPLIIIVSLIGLWINAAIIDQSYNTESGLNRSLSKVKRIYLRLLIATIILAVSSMLLAMIPVIGGLLTVVLVIVLFFYAQEIVLRNRYPIESFVGSAKLFKNNVLRVILFFILLTIISSGIFILGSFPVILEIQKYFHDLPLTSLNIFQIGNAIASLHPKILFFLIITSFISAFVKVFEISSRTRFYLRLK